MSTLKDTINDLKSKVKDGIILIKLEEICKSIEPIKATEKVDDNHLVSLMQYYELINELQSI